MFDVTLNGLGSSKSPLKLMFDPPFLAVTLAIVAALLLAGPAGDRPLRRAAAGRERAIAFGKAALVDNSAALVRKARPRGAARRPLCRDDPRAGGAVLRLPAGHAATRRSTTVSTRSTRTRSFSTLAAGGGQRAARAKSCSPRPRRCTNGNRRIKRERRTKSRRWRAAIRQRDRQGRGRPGGRRSS